MIRSTVATLAVLTMSLFATGCQNSGQAEARVDTERPVMAADADAYTRPYTVSTDTSYMRSSSDTTASGTLRSGDVVYLREAPTGGLVQARTSGGQTVWVRSGDLTPRTTR
jgi:hypothetical protein